jgi:hypothetical protein
MRVAIMLAAISLAASSPGPLLAQSTASAQAGQPAATAQSAPAATQQAASTPVAQASAQPNLDEIECRSLPPTTGTRLGASRECHTIRQWNERQREEQRMLQQQQNLGSNLSN